MIDMIGDLFNEYITFYRRNGFAVFSLVFAIIYTWHIFLRTCEFILKVKRYKRGDVECNHGQN